MPIGLEKRHQENRLPTDCNAFGEVTTSNPHVNSRTRTSSARPATVEGVVISD